MPTPKRTRLNPPDLAQDLGLGDMIRTAAINVAVDEICKPHLNTETLIMGIIHGTLRNVVQTVRHNQNSAPAPTAPTSTPSPVTNTSKSRAKTSKSGPNRTPVPSTPTPASTTTPSSTPHELHYNPVTNCYE